MFPVWFTDLKFASALVAGAGELQIHHTSFRGTGVAKRFGAALAASLLLLCSGAPAGAVPAMWRVSGGGSEVYLFGSMHLLDPAMAWRTPAYDAAYARADVVWFEADVVPIDHARLRELVARYGVDPEHRLSERLTAQERRTLARILRRCGMRPSDFDRLRPWAAALALETRPLRSRGLTVEAGVDVAVTREAKTEAKSIRTFETIEDQVRMFASLPEAAQMQYLRKSLRDETSAGRRIPLEQEWAKGDVARLSQDIVVPMRAGSPAFYDMLLKRRNLAWADALSRAMADPGVQLVNVGALHLMGADGLPALLTARGFKVERVQ
jgi:uncharacterized protein YbaP (TraB family)